MKHLLYILLSFCFCLNILLLPSCNNEKGANAMETVFWGEFQTDDSTSLDVALTHEYDLDDLKDFFEYYHMNEYADDTSSALRFSDVHQQYPVEIIRSNGYSVYKVCQGGYYYVFWIDSYLNGREQEPEVYFSAYIKEKTSIDAFNSLSEGISNMTDVRQIDPSLELTLFRSSGTYSYSYINEKQLLEIRYKTSKDENGTEIWIVERMNLVKRKDAPCRYSSILSCDLP